MKKKMRPTIKKMNPWQEDPQLYDLPHFLDLLFLLTPEGRIVTANPMVLSRTGRSHAELEGEPFYRIFPDYQHNDIKKWLENPSGEPVPALYLKLESATGEPLYLHCSQTERTYQQKPHRLIRAIEVTEGLFPDTEKSLAEEMFFKAFHSNPALMAISNFENSQYIDVNESFLKNLGYSRDEIIGHTSSELQLFVDLVQSDKFLKKLRKLSKVRDFEVTVKTRSGEPRYGLFSAETIMLCGQPCLLTIINDITDRKLVEEELEISERRFRELAEMLPLMLFEARLDGTITFTNQFAFKTTRYTPGDVKKGLSFFDLIDKKELPEIRKTLKRIIRRESDENPLECTVIRKDGTEFAAQIFISLIFHENKPAGFRGVLIDITERKKNQEELETEKAYLTELIESAPEAIVLVDNESTILQINSEFERLFGYTRKEAIGKNLDRLVTPGKHLKQAEKITSKIAGGKRIELETKRVRKDGSLVDVSILGTPIIVNNTQIGVLGIYRDITQRKKAETVQRMVNTISKAVITTKNLEELFVVIKKELSKLMDTSNFFIALYDKENNSISLPFFRDEKDKFNNIPAGKTITSYVIRTRKSVLLKAADMKKLEEEGKIELVGTNCKVWMGVPLRSKKEVIGIISLQNYQDASAYSREDLDILEFIADQIGIAIEWKKAESELHNSLEKYRAVAETTIAGIGITDADENLTYVNAAFAEMLGYDPTELTGKNLSAITTHEKYQYFREQTTKRVSGLKSQYETTFIRKDGTPVETLVHASPLFDESRHFRKTLAVIIDISRLKETQEELIRAKEIAEEAARAKQQFLSTMSHEIRTPMNAVIGMTHLLLQENPRPDQMENLHSLKFSSENLLVLINDVLDYSKIEAGKIVFEEVDFNLHSLLEGLRQSFVFQASDKNIQIECHIEPDVPKIVIGDPVRLNQVLINLMSNAMKFTEQGKVSLSARVVGSDKKITRIEFSVSDTGIGISPDIIGEIFNSFVQASPDTTRKYGGTGLGLAICKQLLRLKHSDIHVESEPEKGARFYFILAFMNSTLKHITDTDDIGKISYKKLNGKKVLLVEDNEINRLVAFKFLRKWGVEVTEAGNGKEALEHLKKNAFDLVLMDLQMPVMDGYEATRLIRSSMPNGKTIPIVALTASIMNEVQEKILTSGMNDLILKPFNPGELYSKIVKVLET